VCFTAEQEEAFRVWSNCIYLDRHPNTEDTDRSSGYRYRKGNMHNLSCLSELCHAENHWIFHRVYHLLAAAVADGVLLRSNCSRTASKGFFVVMIIKVTAAYQRTGTQKSANSRRPSHMTFWVLAPLCRSDFYHLRQLRPVLRSLTHEAARTLVHAFIPSRLDYCNSLLYGVCSEPYPESSVRAECRRSTSHLS